MDLTGKTKGIAISRMLMLVLVANIAACGTILHPERQGQRAGGNLDVGVVILDGLGLFFFIIPGVIAYAVDFNNHTIYMPGGHRSSLDQDSKYVQIHIDGKMDQAAIESALRAETGKDISLNQPNMQIEKLESSADLDARFAQYAAGSRVALAQ
jgi:hypothetical protein